jgi:dihydroneopterin aldolase
MSTKVRLVNLRFEACHGATEAERSLPRRFEVDVELEGDFDRPERSDLLADAVDYSEVATVVMAIGKGPVLHLVEALARRMVDALGERWPERAVSVEVRKLNPPNCPGTPAYAAVRVQRAPRPA